MDCWQNAAAEFRLGIAVEQDFVEIGAEYAATGVKDHGHCRQRALLQLVEIGQLLLLWHLSHIGQYQTARIVHIVIVQIGRNDMAADLSEVHLPGCAGHLWQVIEGEVLLLKPDAVLEARLNGNGSQAKRRASCCDSLGRLAAPNR